MTENLKFEKIENIAIVTINRPDKLNCLNTETYLGLFEVFDNINKDDEIRAVVLTGAGRCFCAGGDLSVLMETKTAEKAKDNMDAANKATSMLFNCSKPVIAAVCGNAAGAGFNLALCCDFIYAASNASFMQAFAKVGLASDCGGHWLLKNAVGPYVAKDLMLTCRPVSAEEAKELGFVRKICPTETVLEDAIAFAKKLASSAPLALSAMKKLINMSGDHTFDEMLDEEGKAQIPLLLSSDSKEGISAFYEKRAPHYTGK